VKKFFEIS
jgi:hypothetical protein